MKKFVYIILFSLLLTLQSCFEIIEQVILKADGSGTFQMVINMSRSKTKLSAISKMKTINGHDVPTPYDISSKTEDIKKVIANTPGISNVSTNIDFTNYIATLNCSFAKVQALNDAVKNVSNMKGGKAAGIEKNYSYDAAANIFTRLAGASFNKDYSKMSNADKEAFATANYTAVYKFENTVMSVSNKDAKISPSKKAVMLRQNLLDIITGRKNLENKIKLIK